MIRSSKFSFVRFEHPQLNDVSLDIPYSLPVFGKHEVGFHFIVEADRAINNPIKLGIADTDGNFVSAFNPEEYSIPLSYRYRLAGLSTTHIFDLFSIKVGNVEKFYNNGSSGRTVTANGFKDLMEEDFGIEMIDDYFVLNWMQPVKVIALKNGTFPVFTPNGDITPVWHEGYSSVMGAPLVETGCFTYALLNMDNSIIGYSNSFKVVDEEAFTSLVTYSCKENAYDFTYAYEDSDNEIAKRSNFLRLPIYLTKPDWPAKRVVNRQSNGTTQVLSSMMEKQYVLETDHMPEVFHECMRAMLLHDFIKIENINIRERQVQVIESDNYTAAWNGEWNLSYAPGKGVVKVSSFGYSNSNC